VREPALTGHHHVREAVHQPAPGLDADARASLQVGCGRIVVSEVEVPDMLANLV
jgi:hypothetical protein